MSIAHHVPFVGKPAIVAINRERSVFMIQAYNLLFAQSALAPVKDSIVSKKQSSLESAIRAKSRRRNFYFFIKRKIIRLNGEILFTILTVFCFLIHGFLPLPNLPLTKGEEKEGVSKLPADNTFRNTQSQVCRGHNWFQIHSGNGFLRVGGASPDFCKLRCPTGCQRTGIFHATVSVD